jgi:hypothetical protein
MDVEKADQPDLTEVITHDRDPKEVPQPEESQTIWEEIKSNPRVIAYSILANGGSLAFGFDILVTGAVTALPAFSYVLFRGICDTTDLSQHDIRRTLSWTAYLARPVARLVDRFHSAWRDARSNS